MYNFNTISKIEKAIKLKYNSEIFQKYMTDKVKNKDLTLTEFWKDILTYRDIKYPNPTWVTQYYARKNLSINDNTIKRLRETAKEGKLLLRSKKEGDKYEYALEDLEMFTSFAHVIQDLEEKEVFKKTVIDGQSRYIMLDFFQKGKSIEEHRLETIKALMDSVIGDVYKIVKK
jgi:hypothetical protein